MVKNKYGDPSCYGCIARSWDAYASKNRILSSVPQQLLGSTPSVFLGLISLFPMISIKFCKRSKAFFHLGDSLLCPLWTNHDINILYSATWAQKASNFTKHFFILFFTKKMKFTNIYPIIFLLIICLQLYFCDSSTDQVEGFFSQSGHTNNWAVLVRKHTLIDDIIDYSHYVYFYIYIL
jgi:hypothetical protein